MPKPRREFVSMEEAVRIYRGTDLETSIEELRSLIEDGHLPCYAPTPAANRMYYKHQHPDPPHKYCRIINPTWDSDRLNFSRAYMLDNNGNQTYEDSDVYYFIGTPYEKVMIRPIEYEALVVDTNVPESNTLQTKLQEKPIDYAARRREEGVTDHCIAKELRQFGIGFLVIGKAIEPEPEVSESGYRKRGKKWVEMTD